MKVASIGETDYGGAGLSSLKLHMEFCRQGINSSFYVNRKTSELGRVIEIPNRSDQSPSPFKIGQYKVENLDVPFTTGLSSKNSAFLNKVWEKYDAILLRWVSVTVSDFQISTWSHRSKPLVWCLSDMAPLTGGCHYSISCSSYQVACTPCPRISKDRFQLPEMVLRRRLRLWKSIVYVSPSKWLARVAKESALGREKDVRVIQTGVELDIFKPHDKEIERKRLGICTTNPVILFGAASVKDSRKGFKFLPELVEILNNNYSLQGKYTVLIVGSGSSELTQLDCDLKITGHIANRDELARAYSVADVAVLPYIQDNLPNVCLESIACGVPVVAFSIGGIPDVVVPNVNGDLARPFDVWDLAYRLINTLNNGYRVGQIREWAVDNIDIAEQARQYIILFEELLEKKNLPAR